MQICKEKEAQYAIICHMLNIKKLKKNTFLHQGKKNI